MSHSSLLQKLCRLVSVMSTEADEYVSQALFFAAVFEHL